MAGQKRRIAPGYRANDWSALTLRPDDPQSADWGQAIAILEGRIRGRFFEPVDELIAHDDQKCTRTFGFAILSIDCLVIETLQGFREGVVNHNGKSKRLFKTFLTEWDLFKASLPQNGDPDALALQIYEDCRCALLHSGATDHDLTVGTTGRAFAFNGGRDVKINRTKLHAGLKTAFGDYLARLRRPEEVDLRSNFKTKMDAICAVT